MTMKELSVYTDEQLEQLSMHFAEVGNMKALGTISLVRKYYNKTVKVVKGRKVPIGTIGKCFWMGSYDNSKYGDPWGIYTTIRVGIEDEKKNVYWTSIENIETM